MCSFFEAFWPEVVATLVGVIAGVPAALWLNRKWLAHKDAREHAKSQERLREALKGLAAAATENLELLTYARDAMTGGRVITGLSLNNSTWAVLRPVVMVDLPNLPLRLWLARFFEELTLFGQHLERAVSINYSPAASMEQASERQEVLWKPLMPFAARLITQLQQIQKDLAAEQAKLPPAR